MVSLPGGNPYKAWRLEEKEKGERERRNVQEERGKGKARGTEVSGELGRERKEKEDKGNND